VCVCVCVCVFVRERECVCVCEREQFLASWQDTPLEVCAYINMYMYIYIYTHTWRWVGCIHMKRDLCICKETYTYEKRPTHVKTRLYIREKTHKKDLPSKKHKCASLPYPNESRTIYEEKFVTRMWYVIHILCVTYKCASRPYLLGGGTRGGGWWQGPCSPSIELRIRYATCLFWWFLARPHQLDNSTLHECAHALRHDMYESRTM